MVFIYLYTYLFPAPNQTACRRAYYRSVSNSQLQISVNGFTPPSALRTGIWSYARGTFIVVRQIAGVGTTNLTAH